MRTENEIKAYAKKIGIDVVRITSAAVLPKLKKRLSKLKTKGYLSKFVNDDFELITNPSRVLTGAESVIVCAISYKNETIPEKSQPELKAELRGRLSRFTWGADYHHVLGAKLEKLGQYLGNKYKTVKFVDTGPTVDRALAKRAGIGWQGKNCSIINPEYGSWIFIGGLITDLKLSVDKPLENNCGSCQKCIKACPTQAIKKPGIIETNKCLGYITLKRGYLTVKERKALGTRIWGCDTCQEVCPANKDVKAGNHAKFKPEKIAAYPDLADLLSLSKVDYQKKIKATAMGWRGIRPLKRNAAIVMGNLANRAAASALLVGLKDNKAIVRAHSAWALAEIGLAETSGDLEKALAKERDKKVADEIKETIARLN